MLPTKCDDLLQYLPSAVRYRREPLADERNALSYWSAAVATLIEPDEGLWQRWVGGEDGQAPPPTDQAALDELRALVAVNAPTFELLRRGVQCSQLQFPPFASEGGSVVEHQESVHPLRQLAHLWFLLARLRIAEGRYAEAVEELIGLGEMGHQICCGESFLMHYVLGLAPLDLAECGGRLLLQIPSVTGATLAPFTAAVARWLAEAKRMARCLAVELCEYALPELARLTACPTLESLVDEFLVRHYHHGPLAPDAEQESAAAADADGRRAWRRESVLYLLEGHPDPWTLLPTVRQLGRLQADRMADLQTSSARGLVATCRRAVRTYRRSRFQSRTQVWPDQLGPGWPYEYLGPDDAVRQRLAEDLQPHVPQAWWARMQPPTAADLQRIRARLRWTHNPLGQLLIQSLLSVNIASIEQLRRERLQALLQALRG